MTTAIHATSARLLSLPAMDSETLLALARERAHDPAVFDSNQPYFWRAQISSNVLDAYFTRMAPSTLRNFAAGAEAGVSFQDSHSHMQLGLGRSLTGKYLEEGDEARVIADFYTIRGLEFLKASYRTTDDFIRAVQAGIVFDVSVGFHGGEHRCSICGEDMWGWDCWHIPGVEYEVERRNALGEVISTETVLAFAWIEDAELSEVSAVYDGATPGAMILKAQLEAERARIKPEVRAFLEQQRRVKLPQPQPILITGEPRMNKTESPTAPPAADPTPAPEPLPEIVPADLRAAMTEAGFAAEDDAANFRAMLTELTTLRAQNKALAEIRDTVISEALAEGVRAHGETFSQDTYRKLMEGMQVAEIRTLQTDWKAIGAKRFPAGRQTIDAPETPETDNGKPKTNVRAFAG